MIAQPLPDDGIEPLRVLVAYEDERRLAEIAEVIASLGHQVVSSLTEIEEVAATTATQRPDVVVVKVGAAHAQALKLISELVRHAPCPVVVDVNRDDASFIAEAAKRGAFSSARHGVREEMRGALEIALRRYADLGRLRAALTRCAAIEQAKGILMERYGITADAAFARLRRQARNTNRRLVEVAEALALTYPLYREDDKREEESAEP